MENMSFDRSTLCVKKHVDHEILFGLEIEAELEEPLEYLNKNWDVKEDGSLRGYGVELVLNGTRKRHWFRNELPVVWDTLERWGINDTMRAATHIHLNVIGMDRNQLVNLLTLYYLAEDIVIDTVCGKSRSNNPFCQRLSDSTHIIELLRVVSNYEGYRNILKPPINTELWKYCALNLAPISTFGSIEFRALRTPQSDYKVILNLMQMLTRMVRMSSKYHRPKDIFNSMSRNGYDRFLQFILPEPMLARVRDKFGKMSSLPPQYRLGMANAQHALYNYKLVGE
jgi:hypothetical protein